MALERVTVTIELNRLLVCETKEEGSRDFLQYVLPCPDYNIPHSMILLRVSPLQLLLSFHHSPLLISNHYTFQILSWILPSLFPAVLITLLSIT